MTRGPRSLGLTHAIRPAQVYDGWAMAHSRPCVYAARGRLSSNTAPPGLKRSGVAVLCLQVMWRGRVSGMLVICGRQHDAPDTPIASLVVPCAIWADIPSAANAGPRRPADPVGHNARPVPRRAVRWGVVVLVAYTSSIGRV